MSSTKPELIPQGEEFCSRFFIADINAVRDSPEYKMPLFPAPLRIYLRWIGLTGLALLLLAPTLLLSIRNQRDLLPNELLVVLASTLLSLILLFAFYKRWPRMIILVCSVLSMLGVLEVWFIYNYGWAIDANVLSLIAETNPAEAADLINSFPVSRLVILIIPAVLALMAWPYEPTSNAIDWHERRLAIFSAFGLCSVFIIAGWLSTFGDPLVPDETFPAAPRGQALALRGAFPIGLSLVFVDYFRDRSALKRALTRNQVFRFGVPDVPAVAHRRVYVLVIGETTRADRLGINGYSRNTTPQLAQRADLVSFKRMYTVSTFTRLSVPVLISRKPPQHIGALFNEASIVTAFKEAGFRTIWISLQAPVGYHESPVSVHAYEADRTIFLNPVDYRSEGKQDNAAIPILQQVLDDRTGKDTFVVIHTLGSHFRYSDRYPPRFRRFLPDRRHDRPLQLFAREDRELLSNSYDNTIAFADHVLDGVIDVLARHREIESWMLYASDHGEALFDDCRMFSGHGQAAIQTQSVASIFWPSPLYRRTHAPQVAAMRAHQHALASTAMLFETMVSLGSLEVPGGRRHNSLAATPLRQPAEVSDVEANNARACPSTP